ncbi:MAG: amino acid permease [Candidatus Aenigmatarchaeota archaeon]
MLQLKKTIGRKTLLFLMLNAILGTGIFFLPAIGARYAGPASLISWIIMSLIAILISLYFAELVSMFPKSGGVYEFIRKAYGEFLSFIIGWTAWIIANITIAMLIVGSLDYLFASYSFFFNLITAIIIILMFNYISYRGIDISTKLLLFFGIITIASILILIIPGFMYINPKNFDPFFVTSIPSIFLAIYFIAETFFGWETATYLSEEVKNARKVIPKVMIQATVIIAIISIALVFVSLGVVNWHIFGKQEVPLLYLSNILFGNEITKLFALIIFIPLIGTAASWIVSSPRLLFAMSRDKVLVPRFKKIHKKYQTPYNAILFQTIVTCIVTVVGLANFKILLSLLVPLVFILYSFIMFSFLKLRKIKSNVKRYYKAPLGRIGPIFIILFNVFLLFVWLFEVLDAILTLLLVFILIFLGTPLYIIIKLQTDEKFIEKFFNKISLLWDKLFPLWYGIEERKKVVDRLKLKNGDNVLDFGCGSGITTYEIAKRIPNGTIVALDLSEKQLEKAIKKIKKLELPNVIFIKEHQLKFKKCYFDAISAVGVLEYMDDPKKTIRKLIKLLKKGGRFSFLSFGKSFGIPAPEFLENREKTKKLFSKLNVNVHIKIEKKKFTEYYYIWGKKK